MARVGDAIDELTRAIREPIVQVRGLGGIVIPPEVYARLDALLFKGAPPQKEET